MNITIEFEGKKYAGVLALVDETPATPEVPATPAVDPAPVAPADTSSDAKS